MAVSINQLTFAYADNQEAPTIQIPSWTLGDNEQVFLYGPSGCGKSTLLSLISGMIPATSGSISIFDKDLSTMGNSQRDQFRANNIGCVFQGFNLIPYLSAIENIQLASRFAQRNPTTDEIHTLLNSLELEESNWGKPSSDLSMGQKQRVAIARALINQPKLIIADEPTSSLDQKNRDIFMTLLMDQVNQQNCALILVSHDQDLKSYFSRVDAFENVNTAGVFS